MNVIVVGLGSMGKRRIRLMKQLNLDVEIIGVDNNPERIDEAKKTFNIWTYASVDEALNHHKIDTAFICTSPLSHHKLIKICLENGMNIFSEINLISDGYEENLKIADEKGLTLFLSSTPIYRDEMVEIYQRLKGQTNLSYIYHVGQYLPDWHPWENYKDFFVGDKRTGGCREIFAIELPWMVRTFGTIRSVISSSKKVSSLQIGYDDVYIVTIEHETGTTGVFIVDVLSRKPVRHLEIFSENNYIEWNGTPDSLSFFNIDSKKIEKIEDVKYTHEAGYSDFVNESAYAKEIKEFFEVLKGKEMKYTLKDDAMTISWIDRIENGERLAK